MLAFFEKASREYDVFHFHAGRSLLPRCWDLKRLDRMGKPYYFEYHGSEIRQGDPWIEGNPYGRLLPQYGPSAGTRRPSGEPACTCCWGYRA